MPNLDQENEEVGKILDLLGPAPSLEQYRERVALITATIVFGERDRIEMLADLSRQNPLWSVLERSTSVPSSSSSSSSSANRKRSRVKLEPSDDSGELDTVVVKKENTSTTADEDKDEDSVASDEKRRRMDRLRPSSLSLSPHAENEHKVVVKREEQKTEARVISLEDRIAEYRLQLSALQNELTQKITDFKSFESTQKQEMRENPPKLLEDPIYFTLYDHPVVTSCGHTFSQGSINEALAIKPECPTCKKSIPLNDLRPLNSGLVPFIDQHKETYYKDHIQPTKTAFEIEQRRLNEEIEAIKHQLRQLGEISPEELARVMEEASGVSSSTSRIAAFNTEILKFITIPNQIQITGFRD